MSPFAPQDGVRFVKNIHIPVSDGIHLAMDLHVPDHPDWSRNPLPVILECIPYRKDDAAPYQGHHHAFAKSGFIGARIDCRGTGASEGTTADEYTPREQQDGAEAVDWIGQQPWCNGKVAMFGASYGGFTSVQVAALQPKHLATIIPVYFTDDRYTDDCHYGGGCMRAYYDIGAYGASMIGMNAMPPYPEYSGESWAKLWNEHLEGNEPYLLTWLAHQTDGEYWARGSIRGRYDKIRCPVFMIGGWRDGYATCNLRTFEHLKVPKKVLVGPWNHTWPNAAIPGPRIDYLPEVIRWCEHWLKGEENGVMDDAPIAVFMQTFDDPQPDRLHTSGYWRTESGFPAKDHSERRLHLCANGRLDAHTPGYDRDEDLFTYRPDVGLCGGLWSAGVPFGLPLDQRPDEIHSLTYTSEVLDVPLEILGRPAVELHASSTAEVMAFVVRLCDVAPDGTSALVCTGALNGTRRNSLKHPEPMAPGEVYKLDILLEGTAWRFQPGHRIRLSVSSADFPNLWPTPYPGSNAVHHGRAVPSRLVLPVVPVKEMKDEVAFAPSPAPVKPYRLPPGKAPWQVVRDVLGNRAGVKLRTRSLARPAENTEITGEQKLDLSVNTRDPADVSGMGRHYRKIARVDGEITVDSSYSIRSTATAFHVVIDLDVQVNGLPHFHRKWVRSFRREWL